MKKQKQLEARELRKMGYSMTEIQKKLDVSKSSVSLWVRDIELTKKQKKRISKKGKSFKDIEKRRVSRLKKEETKRQFIIGEAVKDIEQINKDILQIIGAMLYWAEGGKTQRSLVRFANADPKMIEVIMVFFRKVCNVPESKFRCHVHIHPHLDYKKAEKYWSKLTSIPLSQFFKTHRIKNKSSKNKKDNLPNGTCSIYICSTELFLQIKGWVKGVYQSVLEK